MFVRLGLEVGKWREKNRHRCSSTNTTAPPQQHHCGIALGASLCSQPKPLNSNPTARAKGRFCWCSLPSPRGPPAFYNVASSNRLWNVHARPGLFFGAAWSLSWSWECPMPVCCTSGEECFEKRPRSQVFPSCSSGQTISSALANRDEHQPVCETEKPAPCTLVCKDMQLLDGSESVLCGTPLTWRMRWLTAESCLITNSPAWPQPSLVWIKPW